jgi:hypothetical protein
VEARDGARTAADLAAYQRACVAMDSDPAQLLVVAEAGQDVVVTMQLSVIPGLARRRALRVPIEVVRVSEAYRSPGRTLTTARPAPTMALPGRPA